VINGLDGVDVGMVAAVGAAVLFGVVYAALRGDRGDLLERLASWAQGRGLDYVAPQSDTVLATFVGEVDGIHIEVEVTRVARGLGVDLPTRLTTVTAGTAGSQPACVLQPAAWVVDRDGHQVGEAVPSGDAHFDARWSARGVDADAVSRLLPPAVRARLLEADAEGLIIEVIPGAVAVPMPGVCADPHELDRRLNLAVALSSAGLA